MEYKKVVLAVAIGVATLSYQGSLYAQQIKEANFVPMALSRPKSIDDALNRKIEAKIKEKEDLGKRIWEAFWACDNFDIDYSNPENYKIDKYGKCNMVEYQYRDGK